MSLIIGALIFTAGLFIGGKIVDRNWKNNAKTFIRLESDGRIYKVVYADDGNKTPLWPTNPQFDGFVSIPKPTRD